MQHLQFPVYVMSHPCSCFASGYRLGLQPVSLLNHSDEIYYTTNEAMLDGIWILPAPSDECLILAYATSGRGRAY